MNLENKETIDMLSFNEDEKIISIWNKTKKKSKPELLKAVLFTYSEDKSDDNFNEWSTYRVKTDEDDDEETFCCCSHTIHDLYFIKNKVNDNVLRVGSECIHKFLPLEAEKDATILRKQLHYQKSGSGKHRMCYSCHRNSIPITEPKWNNTCKKCQKSGLIAETKNIIQLNGRECSECHKVCIPDSEPSWKTQCQSCYKANHPNYPQNNEDTHRRCETCKKLCISKEEPFWKKKCVSCYIKTKS